MASVITHGMVAAALAKLYIRNDKAPTAFWMLAVGAAMLPDADVVGLSFGIAKDEVWGHRGFSHSFLFAFLLAVILGFVIKKWWPMGKHLVSLILFYFVATASHALLDACTNGGDGVTFFFPFNSTRYFFPWRPIEVSPIGVRPFFTSHGLFILANEMICVWLPSALLVWTQGYVVELASPARPKESATPL